ncbi:hypothetical protein [Streptomyces sp.]|uniref:hypothetical protein n=1 Tax=Streptomyces sp. TaxID=1931 RepID=UPI0028120568|nr:hypothetical protein [Streptomyces sp.]
MTRARFGLVGLSLAALLALTGCAPAVDPIERLGRKAAQRVAAAEPVAGVPDPRPMRHMAWNWHSA